MAELAQPPRVFRFGSYEADLANRELRRDGLAVRLQGQPFEILALLLEHAGQLITREQLRARLWSTGTVVEFDHSVHTAVTKLRDALGDDADNPRFIATVPRHGYRFIAPVSTPAPIAPPPSIVGAPRSPGRAMPISSQPQSWLAVISVPLRRAFAIGIVTLLTVVVTFLLIDRHWLLRPVGVNRPTVTPTSAAPTTSPAATAISHRSVAVLPFVDMSEKKDQEYLSDGMAEEIINLLVKMPELYVPARTSSFYFKDKPTKLSDIARELGVTHVLEGSVRRSGDHLRVTATLLRADSGSYLWSETYDRQINDVFKVQDEIAGAVVTALKVSLLEGGISRTAPTASVDAYTLYLRGRALFHRGGAGDDAKAADALEQALKLDHRIAPAWALLSKILVDEYEFGRPYDEVRVDAHRAAEQALRLDRQLAEAHVALASVYQMDWRWDAADAEIKQALLLEPGNADAFRLASYSARRRGQMDLALRAAESARAHDPLGWENYDNIMTTYYFAGRPADAQATLRKSFELNPLQAEWHTSNGFLLLARGDPAAALAEFQRDHLDRFVPGTILALDALGRRSEADRELALAEDRYGATAAYQIAKVYASRNDLDSAFAWLERAYRSHEHALPWLKTYPLLKNLRPDPRYKVLLRKMNLPE